LKKHDLDNEVLRAPLDSLHQHAIGDGPLSTSSRRKLTSILLAVAIFVSLAMLTASVLGGR